MDNELLCISDNLKSYIPFTGNFNDSNVDKNNNMKITNNCLYDMYFIKHAENILSQNINMKISKSSVTSYSYTLTPQ